MASLPRIVAVARRWRPSERVSLAARRVGAVAAVSLVSYVFWKAARGVDVSSLHALPLLACGAFSVVAWLGLAAGWTLLSPLPTRRSSLATWCSTQVLRYLPGIGWAQVARATSVRSTTAGKASSVVIEAVATLAVALAVGGGLYATQKDHLWALLMLVPLALGGVWALIGRKLGLPAGRVTGAMAAYLVSWTAYSLATVFAQQAVGGSASPLLVAGAGCLAWSFGFLTVITPGGVGARELAYVALMAGALPQSELAGAALVSRVASTLAELSVLVVVLAGRRWLSVQRARAAEETSIGQHGAELQVEVTASAAASDA